MTRWRARGLGLLFVVVAVAALGRPAQAAEFTEVIDAFDVDDVFDFTFRVTYGYQLRRSKLTEQCEPGEFDAMGCVPDRPGAVAFRDVARYTHQRHTLTLDAIFGLYRDLQFYTSWPLILLDRRELSTLEESNVRDVWDDDMYVLRLPFNSADRSGIDWFSVGVSWLPFNQERNETLPTWLIDFQARFAIGSALQPACSDSGGAVSESTGTGADGRFFTTDDDTQPSTACNTEGGMSPRTTDLRLQMSLARRFGILEPYMGFMAMLSLPDKQSLIPYSDWGNTPFYAETHFGLEIIPWEREEANQFFRISLHFWGGWNRETLIYGPLFDVLGTNPNMQYDWDPLYPSSERGRPDGRAPEGFDGLTRSESYGSFGGRLTLTIQAARYVKFALGVTLAHEQEHFITFTDMCAVPQGDETADARPPCARTGGIFNEESRQQIDSVGQRFRSEETTIFEAFARAYVQF